jgi:hypothetical protein
MYTYILKMLKEQREEVKRRQPKEFGEQDVKINIDRWESARPLWQVPMQELREIIKSRLDYVTEEDLPTGHTLNDEEEVRLIVDWDSDKKIFEDEVEIPKPEKQQQVRNPARRRF